MPRSPKVNQLFAIVNEPIPGAPMEIIGKQTFQLKLELDLPSGPVMTYLGEQGIPSPHELNQLPVPDLLRLLAGLYESIYPQGEAG